MSQRYIAEVFCNGETMRKQNLGNNKNHWRSKQVLKALFNEVKPLAKKYQNNIYYIELKRHEYSSK